MNLADCYRILGLRSGASFTEIKASYRRLARQYHPDMNPDDQRAKDRFITLTEAYRFLASVVKPTAEEAAEFRARQSPSQSPSQAPEAAPSDVSDRTTSPGSPPKVKITTKPVQVQYNPNLSESDRQLKQASYEQLQQFLKLRRFPRAIALVEGLAQRIPQDPEVRQWQAITYQRWGRQLVDDRQLDKARLYLKKALRTDPHNRSLWAEVEKDFRRMEQVY